MTKYKDLVGLKKVSIFLIALPYLCFNYENTIHSPFFSLTQLQFIFATILLIDMLIKWILFKINEKAYTIISLFILFINILFFYGLYITTFIQMEVQKYFLYVIRGRTIIEFFLGLFILLIFFLKKKHINFRYLNIFLIIFSLITITTSVKNFKEKRKEEYKSSFIYVPTKNSHIKPIILIISDEYTSPDGLYQIFKDSCIYQFSNKLSKKGWITKNSFYTYEVSTIHSLSSLFNFNLSKNKKYSNELIANIAKSKLAHAIIADSLEKKKVDIINFGIFHIGKYPYFNRLYFYPNSLIEDILIHSIYYTIKSNTGNFNKSGLASSYYPMETHNRYIFTHLIDTLSNINQPKSFVYTHLYMPHGPIHYKPLFTKMTVNNINNYKAYWNFTNQKLELLLTALIKENKFRIILTGDHGYRGDKRINPNYTFTAFYGFNQESIDAVKSVQDLGSLVYGGF